MKCNKTAVFDAVLQLAALLAVLFVLHASVAYGAESTDTERAVIAESLRAGLSPSLALAVAAVEPRPWTTRTRIRSEVRALQAAVVLYPGRLDRALAHYAGPADRGYAAAVRVWKGRFDAEARAAARALRAHRPVLDDFDGAIAWRARAAGRRLDDFPLVPRKG